MENTDSEKTEEEKLWPAGVVDDSVHVIKNQEDWPDPWPSKGMTNQDWARMLLAYLFGLVEVPEGSLDNNVQYLARALDIACMYSQPPGQKIRLRLCDLLEEAMNKLEDSPNADHAYLAGVRSEVESARRFKGR